MKFLLAPLLTLSAVSTATTEPVHVGSKTFTESVILGELARLSAPEGLDVRHRRGLGGSRILFEALKRGEIDVYPEYTGTLRQELLDTDRTLADALAGLGLAATGPLGFNNTYAMGMRSDQAAALGIETIGDLAGHPDLSFGFSNEFMDRGDGWPGLREYYDLPQTDVNGMDHDLAYRALSNGDIDVIDLYRTDPEIEYYDLTVLEDDRGFFPKYEALYLYRQDLADRAPGFVRALGRLAGGIGESQMVALNHAVKLGGKTESQAAAGFLGIKTGAQQAGRWQRIGRRTVEHLILVGVSLGAAIALAIPLGILAWKRARLGQAILGITGILQTVPSLAMYVFLIPIFGIGAEPAIAALFVYSLLPIVRNTHAGLRGIPSELKESARALGLSPGFRLRRIELPLARGAILAGIKTAAVINIGIATLGALIGAGGYGQPILTGIRLDDMGLILEGAVPAALMALVAQLIFELFERRG